jgi:site-specific recombinase XerD
MGEITLRKALDDYKIVYMPSRNFAQRTRTEYLNDLEDLIQFLEQLGLRDVKDIGLPHLERYLAELDNREIAGSTRKRKVVAIRSFLSFLYQDEYISVHLAKRLIPPFAEIKTPRYLTKPEYERLLQAASHSPRDFALIQLLLQTGIKLSELTQLTINDVDLPSEVVPGQNDNGYLHIKGRERQKARVLRLNQKACLALDKHLKLRPDTNTLALFTNRFGEPLGPRGVEKILKKYVTQVRITDASVQTLRHTFGTHHAAKDTPLETIQAAMGVRDPRSMTIYVALARELRGKELQQNSL